jgi:hypothetical protein
VFVARGLADALGGLTGGIAHDVNSVLAMVKLTLEIVADALAECDLRDCVANAATAAEQGTKATAQRLAFARRQPMQGGRAEIGTGPLREAEAPVLRKPFSTARLREAAAEMLATRAMPESRAA